MLKSFALRIYLVALALRLVPIFLTAGLGMSLDDMFQYDMLARSLAAGNGFRWYAQQDLDLIAPYVDFDLSTVEYDPIHGVPTSFRAPLYPSFLALVYSIFGTGATRFFAARLAQAILLGAPLAPLTYLVSKRLFSPPPVGDPHTGVGGPGLGSERAAQLAAWVVACYPLLLVYPLGLGTENPFFVLLLASFLFLLQSIENPTASRLLPAGLFLGLTALTRSVILLFAIAAFCLLLSLHGKRTLLAMLTFTLVITPWVVRNSLLHQKLTGIETSMGYNLYLGYHPQGNGSFVFGPSLDLLTILDDAQRDQVGTEKAIEFIRSQPGRFAPLVLQRLGFFFGLEKRVLLYFYSNNLIGYIPPPYLLMLSTVLLLPFIVVSISSALGLVFLRSTPGHVLLVLLLVTYILPHILILSEDRFHLALVPYMAILAAQLWVHGLNPIRQRWHESRMGKAMVMIALAAVFLLVANWGFELVRDADKISQILGPDGNQTYFPY